MMKIQSWLLDNWYVDCGWTLIGCRISCGCYLVVVIGPLVCYLCFFLISDMCCLRPMAVCAWRLFLSLIFCFTLYMVLISPCGFDGYL